MAEILPFKAMRFSESAGDPVQLVCPPYDIISEEERQAFLAENACNIIRLERPCDGEDPYAAAGEIQQEWLNQGILQTDPDPTFYLYEMEFSAKGASHRLRGIIARVKLEEFEKGIILPHEETLTKAKEDRFRLMEATGSNFSQIYSLYDDNGTSEAMLDKLCAGKPDAEVTDRDGTVHRIYRVTELPVLQQITGIFADKKLYIADGHHRYETALNYRNFLRQKMENPPVEAGYVMMMLVSLTDPGLLVLPTHRVVRGLTGFDKEKLFRALSPDFDIHRRLPPEELESRMLISASRNQKAFGFYDGKELALLTYRGESVPESLRPGSKALRGLDVTVLHTLILERVLGIDRINMAKQINLSYTRDKEEAFSLADNGKANCVFILNPTRVEEIRDVAKAGEKMPQKSTYFYPKLITGLVMNHFFDPRSES